MLTIFIKASQKNLDKNKQNSVSTLLIDGYGKHSNRKPQVCDLLPHELQKNHYKQERKGYVHDIDVHFPLFCKSCIILLAFLTADRLPEFDSFSAHLTVSMLRYHFIFTTVP